MFRSGVVPEWNPYQMAGMPLVGLHAVGMFSPPHAALVALLAPARAYGTVATNDR